MKSKEKIRVLQLNKWDIIKQIRKQERGKLAETLETMKWARAWCIIAAIYELIQRVYTNYSEYRRKKIERVMRRTCAMKLNKKWLAIMKRKGATLEARQGRTVKYCL